ncbi:MAG: PEGA domain-containing protein, partial [Archangium sp.]|nr:PEGA domain-containing protein [Archangium sp.]
MISALFVATLLAAAPKADSKPASPPPSAAETAELAKAKELAQAAQRLYKLARYAEAIAKFEEAYAIRPHPQITFNIGRCYEQLGEIAKAMRSYRDYLRLSPNAADRETVADAITNLERRLREKGLQQLMVFSEPSNARITVDGKDLGNSPVSVELIAGNHTLSVSAEGYEKAERSFVMQLARGTEMTIALRPIGKPSDAPVAAKTEPAKPELTPTPPAVTSPVVEKKSGRVWTWVAGGIAVAGAGAGVGLGAVAAGKANEYNTVTHTPADAAQLR